MQKLVDRLEEWSVTPGGQSVLAHRAGDDEWWAVHAETVGWLLQLEERMDGRDDRLARSWAAVADRIHRAIFCTDVPMDSALGGSGHRHLTGEQVAIIGAVASAVESEQSLTAVSPELKELQDFNIQLRELIIGASELSTDEREYLLALLGNLDQAITDVRIKGVGDVRSWADQLSGAMARIFGEGDSEEADKFRKLTRVFQGKLVKVLSSPFAQSAIGSGVGTVVPMIMGQLGTG